jgi:hypothetical protein
MKKQIISAAILASLGIVTSLNTQAAVVNNGDILTITAGATSGSYGYVTSGSYYGVDSNNDSQISLGEKTLLSQGTTGLVIGVITPAGASHAGPPTASDTNAITAPDYFFGNTGSWHSSNPITGSTTSGLDMSGWNWPWAGIPSIPLGSGAWQPLNCAALGCTGYTFTDGIGRFQWDGVYGHSYLLDFASTGVHGDPSGFGDVHFYTHLEGIVTAAPVPVPAALWLFGSGVMGLFGFARTHFRSK